MPDTDDRIPVLLLTGFLGSGKTTVLNRLVSGAEFADTAVIINEFGEIGLDHQLVRGVKDEMVLLKSGCLCCTVRSDLADALRDLFLRRVRGEVPEFERVAIETTGLADPVPILETLLADPLVSARYRPGGVVTTVDAVNGEETLDRHAEAVNQVAVADLVLLTKTDLAGDRERIEARLHALNPGVAVVPCAHGGVPAGLFTALSAPDRDAGPERVEKWLGVAQVEQAHHHVHDHDHDRQEANRHDEHVRAFSLRFERPLSEAGFTAWVEMMTALRGPDLLRVKAILNLEGHARPVVFHAAQKLVHPPVELEAWPDQDRGSRFVFITRDIGPETIRDTLEAFDDGARV